jgi:di/tricarboxylate transporter
VGASTALFGVFAAQGMYFLQRWSRLGPGRNLSLFIYIVAVLFCFIASSSTKNVDAAGHIGGYTSGMILYYPFISVRRLESKEVLAHYAGGLIYIIFIVVFASLTMSLSNFDCSNIVYRNELSEAV